MKMRWLINCILNNYSIHNISATVLNEFTNLEPSKWVIVQTTRTDSWFLSLSKQIIKLAQLRCSKCESVKWTWCKIGKVTLRWWKWVVSLRKNDHIQLQFQPIFFFCHVAWFDLMWSWLTLKAMKSCDVFVSCLVLKYRCTNL